MQFDGWYYFMANNLIHRSTSWAGVEQFNAFMVPGPTQTHFIYLGGPIATSREFKQYDPIDIGNLALGDIIQFDWVCTQNCQDGYDHSAIVVDIQYNYGMNRYDIFVDAHTDDLVHHNIYLYPAWSKIRFIHIFDRLRQPLYLPSLFGGNYPAIPNFTGSIAYPAPGQENIANPDQIYPAP